MNSDVVNADNGFGGPARIPWANFRWEDAGWDDAAEDGGGE